MKKTYTIILLVIMFLFVISSTNKYKENRREECNASYQETKSEMMDVAERFIETLNNQDYDTFLNLHSNSYKENFSDVDSMYEFLDDEIYGFSNSGDYNDYSFKIIEKYCVISNVYNRDELEEAFDSGVGVWLEFGNSEKKYKQRWEFTLVLEDDEIRIDDIKLIWPVSEL